MIKLLILCISLLSTINISLVYGASFTHKNLYLENSTWHGFDKKKFRLCRIGKYKETKEKIIKKMKVHFDNNSYIVEDTEQEKIVNFLEKNFKKGLRVVLEGHADIKGNDDYNNWLSFQRNQATIKAILNTRILVRGTNVRSSANGEKYSTIHHRKDRFVTIKLIKDKVPLKKFNRVYLIDASYSLRTSYTSSNLTFDDIKQFKFPKKSMVYVIRAFNYDCKGRQLNKYEPNGYTFFKDAMGTIATFLKGKASVTIYSDGEQDISHESLKMLDKAIKKSIKRDKTTWTIR